MNLYSIKKINLITANIIMACLNYIYLTISFILISVSVLIQAADKYSFKEASCRLIEYKFIGSNPWISYPVIFEPIKRGKLTLWTAFSTIPTSEFKCYGGLNTTEDKIILEFRNPTNKLEWTFYDVNKGITYNGVSVDHSDDAKYIITLRNKKSESYLDCNSIVDIVKVSKDQTNWLQTSCPDCSHFLLQLINSQLKELIKIKLDDQIIDNLYWHLTQIVSSQQYNNPISVIDDQIE